MGDLLRSSRNKLLRRLTAHGSVSIEEPTSSTSTSTSTGTPASPPSKKPVTATPIHRVLEEPILEQPKPLPAAKTAINPSLVAPAVIVQEATPPPVPRVPGPPPKSSSIVRANSPRPGPDRKVAFSGGVAGRTQPAPSTSTAKTITPPTKKEDSSISAVPQPQMMTMSRRKVWIKRPGASPTLVQINHDDVVDEVRDLVLRKFANSLGRTFDAPDVTIKIVPRERTQRESERTLNPEESIALILDTYYPGGQGVDEALLVDVAAKRTPKPSPRIVNHMSSYFDDARPAENDGDYFSSMPVASPNANGVIQAAGNRRPSIQHAFHPHSMAILETGLLPALHSPGIRKHRERPRAEHHAGDRSRGQQRSMVESAHAPTPPPLPTPPVPENLPKGSSVKASTPPLDRMSSPRPHNKNRTRDRKSSNANDRPAIDGRKTSDKQPSYSFLGGIVPPINVLIVEDNPINLRLLEMFAKRLKVRWSTAMDGREAVNKWRKGGFHLVLMDIQLPIMSGLEATKEIRRLERVNGIGVFARSEGEERVGMPKMNGGADAAGEGTIQGATNGDGVPQEDDKLDGVFKSPVIIVALTASSLQSDRHEALAAGCNDFLTKPVSFVYLESKVMEWGCMQALIDFDGWRKWKDMAAAAEKQQATLQANEDPATRAKREAKEAKKAAMMAKMAQRA